VKPAELRVLGGAPPRERAGSAAAIVEARLGRAPQDMLEAAVVLEAWAGVPAQRALETGAALMPRELGAPRRSVAVLPPVARRPEALLEACAFVVSVLAIALWAAPLVAALGVPVVTRALTLALPLTLALQWGLRSRYLSRPRGLAALSRARGGLALAALAVAAAPSLLLAEAGAVAGLLTITWTGGTVLMRRGWAAVYAAIVLAATVPMAAGLPPLAVLAVTAGVTAAVVAAALRGRSGEARVSGGRWGRAAVCALLGAGLGAMLVADRSLGWGAGASPALALLPSTIAGVWAGLRIWRLDDAIPRALAGIPAVAPRAPVPVLRAVPRLDSAPSAPAVDAAPRPEPASPATERRALRAPLRTFLGALARLLGGAALGSVVVAALVPVGAGVLAAFALLALATLLVSMLESMGRTGFAVLGIACAVAAELAVPGRPFAGAGLAAGAAAGVLVLLPAAAAPLLRPARTLATSLWIA
jgi:hypothetical protein